MNDQTNKNTDNKESADVYGQDNDSGRAAQRTDNLIDNSADSELDDTDKYLAMEQPGVQYTPETDGLRNSDQVDYSNEGQGDEWNEEGGNSKNSDAFNQDDYILDDNVDLDEDQNQSISSDDEDFEESNERYTN